MKPETKEIIRDTAVGVGIGCAAIVPGISGGTVALISGAFNKLTTAAKHLFSKFFWKNLLILLPFGIGAIIGIAGLYFPITLAFENCMLAIVCLFAAFMIGSIPSVIDEIKDKKPALINIVLAVIGGGIVIVFGVLSLKFNLNTSVQKMFDNNYWYLYPIIFGIGIISSMGIIVPGFSGAMLLMVIGFYDKIMNLVKQIPSNPSQSLLGLLAFAIGVIVGFCAFSSLMKKLYEVQARNTNYVVLGFLIGSVIAIYVNEQMFNYLGSSLNTLDYVLAPILTIVGLVGALLIVKFARKAKIQQNNAEN